MKKNTYHFTCVTCSTKQTKDKEGLPFGWVKVTPPASPEVPVREDVFFCDQCVSQNELAEVVNGVRGIPTDYVPYLEIQEIFCDGRSCSYATKTIVGPASRLQGIDSLPWGAWVTCKRGIPVPAESHFCIRCSLELKLFPPYSSPVEEGEPDRAQTTKTSGLLSMFAESDII